MLRKQFERAVRSGYTAFDDDVKNCLAAGMSDHVAKPIELENLFATLSAWLG
jgi:CheY-like chemotaxis protein